MDKDIVLKLYERMLLIRGVDERLMMEYPSRNVRMAVHLSIGQEGIGAGVLLACRPTDCCLSTHRCHAHYLGKGGDLNEMIDEFYSLPTGCSRGYGGSMHLFDKKVNMWGSGAIVGGSLPIAVGIALALKQLGRSDVCVVFTGDGGVDEGVFFESINLAALLKLPVLFVVENNFYSTLTPQAKRQASLDIVAKARSFGVDSESMDGNDALTVYERTLIILEMIRQASRPYLVEATTYRLCAHVGPGSDFGSGRRPESELAVWKEREPIGTLLRRIQADYPELLPQCRTVEQAVAAQIETAFAGAKARFDVENTKWNIPAPKPPDPSKV